MKLIHHLSMCVYFTTDSFIKVLCKLPKLFYTTLSYKILLAFSCKYENEMDILNDIIHRCIEAISTSFILRLFTYSKISNHDIILLIFSWQFVNK